MLYTFLVNIGQFFPNVMASIYRRIYVIRISSQTLLPEMNLRAPNKNVNNFSYYDAFISAIVFHDLLCIWKATLNFV